MNTCTQCKEEFEAKRATSRYCSSTCRSRGNRATLPDATLRNEDDATLSVTDKDVSVTFPNCTQFKETTCPEVEHAQGCLQCSRLQRDNKDDTLQCDSKYYDCSRWGKCIDSYHLAMCAV